MLRDARGRFSSKDRPVYRLLKPRPLYYYVAYRGRNEHGIPEFDTLRIKGIEEAITFAREYDVPGGWALVYHPETFVPVLKLGTPFAALPPASLLKAVRRPPQGAAERRTRQQQATRPRAAASAQTAPASAG